MPGVSTDGYTYDDSEAIDGDKFLGLALDEVNEDDKTDVYKRQAFLSSRDFGKE